MRTALLGAWNEASLTEQRRGQLHQWLARRLPALDHSIRLPAIDPAGALMDFVRSYISQLPGYLETTCRLLRQLGSERLAEPAIRLIGDFFTSRSDDGEPLTLLELLHQAYLAHRLIEEINDYCVVRLGGPRLPPQMLVANLVCHNLIGEPLANELDGMVVQTADSWLAGRPLPTVRRVVRADWPTPPASVSLAWPRSSTLLR